MNRRVAFSCVSLALGLALVHCSDAADPATPSAADATVDEAAPTPPRNDSAPPMRDASDLDGDVEEAVTNPSPQCRTLCVSLIQTCSRYPEHVQFQSINACLRACQFYPPGNPGEFLGNSLACRIEHVEDADPEDGGRVGHCGHAGAFGWNGCGPHCESFCQLAMGWCPKSKTGAPFPSLEACLTDCETFVYAPARPNDVYQFNAYGPETGDSIDCRAYQLIASLEGPAARDIHCPLAATKSAACR